ncbi:3-ketoacyl-CoA thiolase [Rubritalea squalenifaciens DSM 18772]|uniref:3-ketoacyl-CoA thiolase n=1 Tax=Rubritalea squalenifaciens DSM 18772 TaxID=1123071 RepID=A0A1M6HIH8_9BACT|nr:thiolase family protein [Rubritalea squalenifaciens]SHJ21942.1 3-ketoacyl-CoA thiolase [Rubritalea squalenifaciens DSM 18772]
MYIYQATRTAFTRMGTSFATLGAADLGKHAVSALLTQSDIDPALIDEVIIGCVCQPADAANVARVIALRAGIPNKVIAATVHRNCASGMESLTSAYERMAAGKGELFVVGGAESMTNAPFIYRRSAVAKFAKLGKARGTLAKLKALATFRPGDFSPIVGLQVGLTDPVVGLNMGETAEVLAREFQITREEQDSFAAESHQKALAAREMLNDEISAVYVAGHAITEDNGLREDSTPQKLATLRPVFEKSSGSVTAGNSSQITDGAAVLLVGSEAIGEKLGLTPLGRLRGYAYAGCDPKRMGLGPVLAMRKLFAENPDLSLDKADLIEINEAFAAQVLACAKAAASTSEAEKAGLDKALGEIPMEKLNRRGGSIALGHPVGATGARLVLTALHQLHAENKKHALTTLCIGGGQGAALWLERV